jgi:AcrR family transcriptional regulator
LDKLFTQRLFHSQETALPKNNQHATSKVRETGKTRLITSAISLFAKKGYDGVSITEIANDAGVSHQLIQHYFDEGKRGLYREAYLKALNQVMSLYVQDMPPVPEPSDPKARLIAVEGIAIFIRNIAKAAASDTDDKKRDVTILVYRETLDPPPDLREDLMKLVWLPTERIRAFLKILLPEISFLSLALMTTAITGPLYHERVISGVQRILWDGMMIPTEKKADFFTAYTLRFLGIDKEMPPGHPYSSDNLDKILFSLT